MFEEAIEQLKRLASTPREREAGLNLPAVFLLIWCIALLFADLFGFDYWWASSAPKLLALVILA